MPFSPTKLTLRTLGVAAALLLLLLPPTARTQELDEIDQTVARISYLSGPVSYNRGDDPDEWEPAATNVPFTIGDRLYSSADGRAELQLAAGNFVRLAPRSYLRALNLTYDTKQFYVGEGAASFNIRRLDRDETIEVNTPNMAVTLEGPGNYRIEVDEDGNSRVAVRRGRAIVAANGREVTVEDSEIRVDGADLPRYEIVALRRSDAFDRWVDERDGRFERAYRSAYDYVSDEVIGAEELRDYGRWEQIPDYGYAWRPERVPVGWQPYSVGQWFWQDPWGWSWLSHEPWGWATCHYGRWAFHRGRWYWVPVGKRARFVRYAPAHVVFVPVRGHVGWFPLHPRDRFVPWWSRRGGYEDAAYVHRTRVVVEREIFVSSRRVTTNIVRDSVVVNEVTSARLMEHQLPIPRRSSLRVADQRESQSFQRPPQKLLARPAVVRSAPPPPPPTFREKLPEIEKRQGAPIAPDAALAMGLRSVKTDNRMPIRPVAVEAGRADFAPRASAGSTPPPQPLSAARGKKLATRNEPFLTNLPQGKDRSQRPAEQKETVRLPEPQQERQRQEREEEQRRALERRQREQEQERQRQERALLEQQRREQLRQRDEQQRLELERQQQLERERQRQARQLQEQQRQEQALRQQQERELERRQKEVERDRQQREKLLLEQQHKEQQLRQQQAQKEPQPHKEQKRSGQQRREEEQRKSGVVKPPA